MAAPIKLVALVQLALIIISGAVLGFYHGGALLLTKAEGLGEGKIVLVYNVWFDRNVSLVFPDGGFFGVEGDGSLVVLNVSSFVVVVSIVESSVDINVSIPGGVVYLYRPGVGGESPTIGGVSRWSGWFNSSYTVLRSDFGLMLFDDSGLLVGFLPYYVGHSIGVSRSHVLMAAPPAGLVPGLNVCILQGVGEGLVSWIPGVEYQYSNGSSTVTVGGGPFSVSVEGEALIVDNCSQGWVVPVVLDPNETVAGVESPVEGRLIAAYSGLLGVLNASFDGVFVSGSNDTVLVYSSRGVRAGFIKIPGMPVNSSAGAVECIASLPGTPSFRGVYHESGVLVEGRLAGPDVRVVRLLSADSIPFEHTLSAGMVNATIRLSRAVGVGGSPAGISVEGGSPTTIYMLLALSAAALVAALAMGRKRGTG